MTEEGGKECFHTSDTPDKKFTPVELRKEIEPWLTALFQSEHLSLLTGAGISYAVHNLTNNSSGDGMSKKSFSVFQEQIDSSAKELAKKAGRGTPNIEDQIRVANSLLQGLKIYTLPQKNEGSEKSLPANEDNTVNLRKNITKLAEELNDVLINFINTVLKSENDVISAGSNSDAADSLMSFLVSFASRSATRERLNIFTTNYDRIMEFGAELAGIRLIDRFVGSLYPIFRSSRLEVDMHYNPPGIRGEPRYLEGVVHFTKLHGSLDWIYQDGYVRRIALPFGAESIDAFLPTWGKEKGDTRSLLIYPNEAKDRETAEYPYVELFRDFAAAVCRPNSTLVLYGYSLGDEHINRIIKDMLTIPSTHLVIIAYGDDGDRVKSFYNEVHRPAQISLLIGKHFGDLGKLVEYYLPKPAIDRTTFRLADLMRARGIASSDGGNKNNDTTKEGVNESKPD
ncbi:MAG: hypothetical protein FJ264_01410 [Planctomycetes bacterium]|nr:hypothetical protein [Planctomycetota bacterium]